MGRGRERSLADEGVGIVVEMRASHSWFHFKRTSSSCCRGSGNVQSWSLSLSLARPLPPFPKRFPDPWCSGRELWSLYPLSADSLTCCTAGVSWGRRALSPWYCQGTCSFNVLLPLALQLFCFRESTFPSTGLQWGKNFPGIPYSEWESESWCPGVWE